MTTNPTGSTRQLAAIMFTDIVGYTALMGKDESNALQLLDRNRCILEQPIEKHDGQLLKDGDSKKLPL